jgi:hypothetical protein
MKLSARTFLICTVALGLAVTFGRCPSDTVEPPPATDDNPAAAGMLPGWPDIVPLRMLAKDLVAREVLASRLALVEGAALFGELERLPPELGDPPRLDGRNDAVRIPGRTREERLCQHVIAHAVAALRLEPPDRAAAAAERLTEEFFAELPERGAIRLPDPAALEPVKLLLERAWAELPPERREAFLGRRRAED